MASFSDKEHLSAYTSTHEERELAKKFHGDAINDTVLIESEALGATVTLISALKGLHFTKGEGEQEQLLRAYVALAVQISINSLANWVKGAVLVVGEIQDFCVFDRLGAITNIDTDVVLAAAWKAAEKKNATKLCWIKANAEGGGFVNQRGYGAGGALRAVKPSPYLEKLRIDLGQGWNGSVHAAMMVKDKEFAQANAALQANFVNTGNNFVSYI